MSLFRRLSSVFFLVIGAVAGMTVTIAAIFARMLINPVRQRLWSTPVELGLPYEEVQFPALDGLRLSGWFIPANGRASEKPGTIIIVHAWQWNRLGTTAGGRLLQLSGGAPVQLLRLARSLHSKGYQVLMFDLRNHGRSAAARPVTFGLQEANDLLGALEYLAGRKDVDEQRIGVIGFAMGANTILYSLPRTNQIRAAIAVQPTSPAVFSRRYASWLLGPLGRLVLPLAELMYRVAGGLRLSAIEPAFTAAGAVNTPVLFVQGKGDPWGSIENVARMAAVTPNAVEPLFVDTADRFGGYQYAIDNPEVLHAFFQQRLA